MMDESSTGTRSLASILKRPKASNGRCSWPDIRKLRSAVTFYASARLDRAFSQHFVAVVHPEEHIRPTAFHAADLEDFFREADLVAPLGIGEDLFTQRGGGRYGILMVGANDQALQWLALAVGDAAGKGVFRVWLGSHVDFPSTFACYTSVKSSNSR